MNDANLPSLERLPCASQHAELYMSPSFDLHSGSLGIASIPRLSQEEEDTGVQAGQDFQAPGPRAALLV